jgi:hypothetical protein
VKHGTALARSHQALMTGVLFADTFSLFFAASARPYKFTDLVPAEVRIDPLDKIALLQHVQTAGSLEEVRATTGVTGGMA